MVRLSFIRLCYHRNFPKRYVEKEMGLKKDPTWKRRSYRYTEHRPWSIQEKSENHASKPIIPLNRLVHAPLPEWQIFRGDMVEILAGRDKGKRGSVSQVVKERNWCFVHGKNLKYEMYAKYDGLPGKMHASEVPLDVVTEVALMDPVDNIATKVEWRYTEEGERVRVSTRTGRVIPIPVAAEETYEYKTKATYKEEAKDTKKDELTEVTYKPVAKTFEEEVMLAMGITETRKPPRTFWY